MAILRGRANSSGHARIPVRVEHATSGNAAALTTSNLDGSWEVELAPGDYVVCERWNTSPPSRVTVPDNGDYWMSDLSGAAESGGTSYAAIDATNQNTVDASGVSAALERRRQAREV